MKTPLLQIWLFLSFCVFFVIRFTPESIGWITLILYAAAGIVVVSVELMKGKERL